MGGALNFLGKGVQPKELNKGARELYGNDHCQIGDPRELNFWVKCSLVNQILAQLEALEWNSFPILRLWSFKFLEICDVGAKVEQRHAEMGILQAAERVWKGYLQGCTFPVPHSFREYPPQGLTQLLR